MNVLRKNRTISYGAIHAINSTSPLYLQPFGVVQLTVSAAGADTDIRLDAVPGTLQLELERCRETSRETLRGTSRETINLQCPDASTQQESALEQPTSQSRRRPPIQQLLWRHKTAPKRTHLRRTQPLTFISRRFPTASPSREPTDWHSSYSSPAAPGYSRSPARPPCGVSRTASNASPCPLFVTKRSRHPPLSLPTPRRRRYPEPLGGRSDRSMNFKGLTGEQPVRPCLCDGGS